MNIYILNINVNAHLAHKNNNIYININKLSNYKINKLITKISYILKIYDMCNTFNIIFLNVNDCCNQCIILLKLHNILYKYSSKMPTINIYNSHNHSYNMFNELKLYKDIVLNPNKTPSSYLKYITSRVPCNYTYQVFNVNDIDMFPLTKAVGAGSIHHTYFVHIFPKNINSSKALYMIGKGVTYDSGGLNIKLSNMEEMKVDMIGSAILISVLNILNNYNYNIHLLIPIVENMISSYATKPGNVIKTMNNKKVEIINTDAEGRLCIADALEYIQMFLPCSCDTLILDIATLTGNTKQITYHMSCITLHNKKATKFANNLIDIGDYIGEYVDTLVLRQEYTDMLTNTNIADIKNSCYQNKSGCLLGGAFINYFVDKQIPWMHLDVASCTYINNNINCYGINLLYVFCKHYFASCNN